jgi:hypothetical protein
MGSLFVASYYSQGYGGGIRTRLRRGKFWEELIVYFHRHDKDRVENHSSNITSIVACVFIAVVTFLPSRCLAAIGDVRTDTRTDDRYL